MFNIIGIISIAGIIDMVFGHGGWSPLRDGDPQVVVLSPVQVGQEVGEGEEGLLLLLLPFQ